MTKYRISPGVQAEVLGARPLLSTPEGGKIALDSTLLTLWQHANGQEVGEITATLRGVGATPELICAAVACLAEAGLLRRLEDAPKPVSPPPVEGDLVSVVIINYNSQEWLVECLPSLLAQSYTPIEIIVVDNGSTDKALAWLAEDYPAVRALQLESTQGLAYALNRGLELARGDYLLLLNPDVHLAPDAVAQMVTVARGDSGCAAVAAKLRFWWAPAFINSLGNQVGAWGWGRDNGLGHLDLGQFDTWKEVPSACFAAALIPRIAWEAVGPLDEGFPMYYEDSEWCYRARLLGYRVCAAPKPAVYHAFGSRVHTGVEVDLSPSKLRNVVQGRLRFAVKIPSFPNLVRFLFSYALEDLTRVSLALFRLRVGQANAVFRGWVDFLRSLPQVLTARWALQAHRTRSDRELFALQNDIPPAFVWNGLPELTWDLVLHHYLPLFRSGKTRPMPEFDEPAHPRLLIISHDIVDVKMAGPGMRYLEMARALAPDLDMTLAVPAKTTLEVPGVCLIPFQWERPQGLQKLVEETDIVLISSFIMSKFPFLQDTNKRLVVDLYDPAVLENLHYYQQESMSQQESLNSQIVDTMNHLIRRGDFFLCGNERQRDFWIGVLAANGRVNPRVVAEDASLRSLIDVVGIGFLDRVPRPSPRFRGIHPAFPENCRIVLWGGGIWNWLDPLSLIKAWPQVLAHHPEARLVFLGTRHPNPLVPPHQMARQTQALASEIGEKDRTIFFIEWLPYEEREGLLCEADIGVTLHPQHVETRYSIRTRVMDYLWADLPVVVSDGDIMSEWVRTYGLGCVVPPLDAEAVAQALIEMLDVPKDTWKNTFAPLKLELVWPKVVEPLRRYGLHGTPAPDRGVATGRSLTAGRLGFWKARLARARFILRSEGWQVLLRRIWKYIQWQFSQVH